MRYRMVAVSRLKYRVNGGVFELNDFNAKSVHKTSLSSICCDFGVQNAAKNLYNTSTKSKKNLISLTNHSLKCITL